MKTLAICKAIQSHQRDTWNIIRYQIALTALSTMLMLLQPSVAQVAKASFPPVAAMTTRQHGPMRLHPGAPVKDGTATSDNWSGYAVTGSAFTFAKGSWHVPEVNCDKTPNTYSAFWVGIDGYSDKTVEQTGTASDCNGTTPQYYAWYEFYPAGSVVITSMPVVPGDVIGASVTYSDGKFTIGINNHTTGVEFHKTLAVPAAKRTSAEWIAEAPCCTTGGGILPLADYDVASFGEDYVSDPDTNYATDSSVDDRPIVDFGSHVEEITMVNSKGKDESVPTALTSDGTSFRVHWESE